MQIIDLKSDNEEAIQQCAALVIEGLSGWPDLPSALDEVRESLEPGRISRVAVEERGLVLGWPKRFRATCNRPMPTWKNPMVPFKRPLRNWTISSRQAAILIRPGGRNANRTITSKRPAYMRYKSI